MPPTRKISPNPDVTSTEPGFPELVWNADGLIPAIVQDATNGTVLMMAWMDRCALSQTLATGETHFYSRSRKTLWHKGGTSGHIQTVESIAVDCDADVLLVKVHQVGAACHEGYLSCFSRQMDRNSHHLKRTLEPVFAPEAVYGKSNHIIIYDDIFGAGPERDADHPSS